MGLYWPDTCARDVFENLRTKSKTSTGVTGPVVLGWCLSNGWVY